MSPLLGPSSAPAAELVRRTGVPSGDGQTRATLAIMGRVARAAAINPRIVNVATDIVRHVPGREVERQVAELAAWARRSIEFLPDPLFDGDWIRTPAFLLDELAHYGRARGDCDDAAVLVAALGMAIGIPARFRAVAFRPGGPFEHVWTELQTPAGWITVDPTRGPERMRPITRKMIAEV